MKNERLKVFLQIIGVLTGIAGLIFGIYQYSKKNNEDEKQKGDSKAILSLIVKDFHYTKERTYTEKDNRTFYVPKCFITFRLTNAGSEKITATKMLINPIGVSEKWPSSHGIFGSDIELNIEIPPHGVSEEVYREFVVNEAILSDHWFDTPQFINFQISWPGYTGYFIKCSPDSPNWYCYISKK